ncbi:AAA family ATPase [Treponema sp. OttesenSCG-928-L16]|nr:AAA family ATPase [Treponema sp. OttesenSCG-928-L16]
MNEVVDLLKGKKQIILQGAPGVGKTYITKSLAILIINGTLPGSREKINEKYQELVKQGQIVFTTFHQSMDYEDFVEGYKPVDKGDTPGFELRDGPFKVICKRCRGTTKRDDAFEDAWKKFIESFEDKVNMEFKTVSKKTPFYVRLADKGALRVGVVQEEAGQYTMTKTQIKEYIINGITPSYNASYATGVAHYPMSTYNIPKQDQEADRKPHVLIIDEINRGNVSKIFGELITLLENDKREPEQNTIGETVTASLTYSNEEFTVPRNLFIIGTMNTADRSLGQIDYALRRRFAFYTIQADRKAIEDYYGKNNFSLKATALAIFDNIQELFQDPENINHDFDPADIMVGHSYFMARRDSELKQKMKYEVRPLLEEYRKDGILLGDVSKNAAYNSLITKLNE